jgi:hypothetical protein
MPVRFSFSCHVHQFWSGMYRCPDDTSPPAKAVALEVKVRDLVKDI